jgi:hypothetical protein
VSTLSPEQIAELRHRIAQHRLADFADYIIEQAAPCYALVVDGPDDYTTTGNTRFGGDPDLPQGCPWPCDGDPTDIDSRFSNFIAQVNFSELPHLAAPSGLPPHGFLYLFVRSLESAAEPVVLDALYFEGSLSSLRRVASLDPDRLCDEYLVDLQPQKVKAIPAISLPHYRRDFRATFEQVPPTPTEWTVQITCTNSDARCSRRARLGSCLDMPMRPINKRICTGSCTWHRLGSASWCTASVQRLLGFDRGVRGLYRGMAPARRAVFRQGLPTEAESRRLAGRAP